MFTLPANLSSTCTRYRALTADMRCGEPPSFASGRGSSLHAPSTSWYTSEALSGGEARRLAEIPPLPYLEGTQTCAHLEDVVQNLPNGVAEDHGAVSRHEAVGEEAVRPSPAAQFPRWRL